MIIWHISDTHMNHHKLRIPEDVDIVIHSGDCTNSRHPFPNSTELWDFIGWFRGLPIKHKVLVAGNHDSAIHSKMMRKVDFDEMGITYLENSSAEIEGFKIWGSPLTPTYGDWCFMMARHKIHRAWNTIPEDVDIVVTHGPPKGILDLTENKDRSLEQVGCKSLLRRMTEIEPMIHCFGHVHSFKHIKNAGIMKIESMITEFSNGSCVEDGKQGELSGDGNVLSLWQQRRTL